MRALIFRHAEKDNLAALDPVLSLRGQKQAAQILHMVQNNLLPKPQRLFASPKARAQQTFTPLAKSLSLEILTVPELNERQASESGEQFERRVKQFLLKIEALPGTNYCVTHLDWIEEALIKIQSDTDLLESQYQQWAPAQSMEFEIHDGLWSLVKFRSAAI